MGVFFGFYFSSRGVIRKLRLAYGDCIGFTNAEYRIALVDFIYSSRGRLERDRGFANPLSLSNTSPDPGGVRCGGAYLLPRVYTNTGNYIQVQVAYPQFRILFSFLCSGYGRSRFSRVAQLVSHVFHYWGGRSFVPAATWGVLCSFVGFALTASRSFVWVENGTG